MELLNSYRNGNYNVKIYDDGTKIRRGSQPFIAEFPESCDIKITNWCDGGCLHCHEESTSLGTPADLTGFGSMVECLPPGVELAIGGGDPLSHPSILGFLYFLELRGIIANITVNARHLFRHKYRLNYLIQNHIVNGVGVTYDGTMEASYFAATYPNAVIHFIMGVHTLNQVKDSIKHIADPKVLFLGYKSVGRGALFYSDMIGRNLYAWFTEIHEFLEQRDIVVAFDNLAIEQLQLKRFFSNEKWSKFYQGDDGKFTFYLDLVKQEYAISSTSQERFKIKENDNFKTMFNKLRKVNGNV